MRRMIALVAALLIAPAAWSAEEWGIENEEKARFEAVVVDILCELTGDCPADCGAGKRQLGLLRDDGTLVLVVKNFDIFAGGVEDLKGFCKKRIVADGLMISSPRTPMFALQFKRLAPDGKWSRANRFSKEWAKAHGHQPDTEPVNQWFRNDPLVKEILEKDGVFGLPGVKPED